jgi:hypothetical protein
MFKRGNNARVAGAKMGSATTHAIDRLRAIGTFVVFGINIGFASAKPKLPKRLRNLGADVVAAVAAFQAAAANLWLLPQSDGLLPFDSKCVFLQEAVDSMRGRRLRRHLMHLCRPSRPTGRRWGATELVFELNPDGHVYKLRAAAAAAAPPAD